MSLKTFKSEQSDILMRATGGFNQQLLHRKKTVAQDTILFDQRQRQGSRKNGRVLLLQQGRHFPPSPHCGGKVQNAELEKKV